MSENATLSPRFLADLAEVYNALRPPPLSAAFLSDLKEVYDSLPVASEENLRFLAERFDEWRRKTKEFVRTRLQELDKDDPLLCPISLFRTMDYGRLETAHTRALAWLLHPEREHGFGTTLLAAFLSQVSDHDCSAGLRVERVESEFPIDGSNAKGRLDVLAEGTWGNGKEGRWLLAIEAKIDAWEGESQLQKYEGWLHSHAADREVFRVFLTPDGSAAETGDEEWESLSFLELVRTFWRVYGELRDKPGFHFLRFYLASVLQDVCDFPRNITEDSADPYALASYLKTVHETRSESASNDTTR